MTPEDPQAPVPPLTTPSDGEFPTAEYKPLTRREARLLYEQRQNQTSADPQSGSSPEPSAPRATLPPIVPQATADSIPAPTPSPAPTSELGLGWDELSRGAASEERSTGGGRPPKRRGGGRRTATRIVVTLVILALIGGGAGIAWTIFKPKIDALAQSFQPNDWAGATGTGSVLVTVKQGAIGSDVADTLAAAGVVKTSDAFYKLLLGMTPEPVFQPGVYKLKEHMSAQAALTLLQNPSSRQEHVLVIPEGQSEKTILADAAKATGLTLKSLQAAAANPAKYGLPPKAKTLEGFLFPATYPFSPGVTADQVISTLVTRAKQAFAADGLPTDPSKLWDDVIMASVVQREAGPNPADLGKIARVFDNRIAQGMLLQSDATVAYGSGNTDTVFTTDAERANAADPYNTYVHPGLPVGPIGNPGDAALKAAVHPTPGDWLYFTVVNLQTGQTTFSTTLADHDAAVAQLQAWCNASAANQAYCG